MYREELCIHEKLLDTMGGKKKHQYGTSSILTVLPNWQQNTSLTLITYEKLAPVANLISRKTIKHDNESIISLGTQTQYPTKKKLMFKKQTFINGRSRLRNESMKLSFKSNDTYIWNEGQAYSIRSSRRSYQKAT